MDNGNLLMRVGNFLQEIKEANESKLRHLLMIYFCST